MNLKKALYIVAFSTITLLSSSCEIVNVLDKRPPFEADLDGAITNAKTAELALTGVYSYLPQGVGQAWIEQCAYAFRTGLMRKPTWWTSGNAVYYYERNWPILNSNNDAEWDAAYNIIKNANFLLTRLDVISDFEGERRNEMRGELHFLKGFAYHRLLVRYAEHWNLNSRLGLVVREDLPAIGGDKKSRHTVANSYKVVLDNLDIAIANAPKYGDNGYASSLAAKAIKAKVLLDMQKYSEAAILANEVIAEGAMEGSYADIFTKASTSKEILFARKFGPTEITSMSTRSEAINMAKWGATASYLKLIGNDPRKSVIIGDSIRVDYRGTISEAYRNAPIKKMGNEKNDLPIIFLRTAEMYLIKAEALMRSGASIGEAYAPIQVLRARAGATVTIPTSQEELEDAILNEWLIELGCENNTEWLAVNRHRDSVNKLLELNEQLKEQYDKKLKPEEIAAYRTLIKQRRILMIPDSEINSNPVEQNPGY